MKRFTLKRERIDPALANKVTWPVWKLSVDPKDLQVPMNLAVKYGVLKHVLPIEQILLPTARAR